MSLLLLAVVSIGRFLHSVLYNLPDAFSLAIFAGKNANWEPIRGMIILATIISFAAYLVRICGKLTFSSFHLQRDSEEREQLTMVFLALIEEGAIEQKERDLILQSLFSRADTGLLGGDSSPTMPLSIIEKLTGGKS